LSAGRANRRRSGTPKSRSAERSCRARLRSGRARLPQNVVEWPAEERILFRAAGWCFAFAVSAAHDHDSHGQGHGHGHGSARAPSSPEPPAREPGHGHGHGHGHGRAGSPTRALSAALGITATFMVVEVAVGFWSGSLALHADAVHMLADAGALVLAIVALHFADKPRTDRTTYGFRRAEVLAAFVNGIALAFVGLLIVKEAVERWITPVSIQGRPMLLTAVGGLIVNLLVAFLLMRGQSNLNVRAARACRNMSLNGRRRSGSFSALRGGALISR
jgi:cobalt-zinc-cadmium efflux system protein